MILLFSRQHDLSQVRARACLLTRLRPCRSRCVSSPLKTNFVSGKPGGSCAGGDVGEHDLGLGDQVRRRCGPCP